MNGVLISLGVAASVMMRIDLRSRLQADNHGSSAFSPYMGIHGQRASVSARARDVHTIFALSAFLVTVIQTGFLLTERGIPSPRQIGLGQALASLANPAGALLFGLWRAPARSKLTPSLLLMGAGFALIGLGPSWQAALAGAAITNLGCGMILPTLITWALEGMPDAARGRGTGTWMCASFLGQFISPLTIVWFKQWSGSLSGAVLCYAFACAAAGLVALLSNWDPWRRRSQV
jgi:MFS family permease